MECTESLNLLSDLHDHLLDDPLERQVKSHLDDCPPCANVFSELSEIVNVSVMLNQNPSIDFPDEDDIWRRMRLADPKIH
jgi:hypothetical protein